MVSVIEELGEDLFDMLEHISCDRLHPFTSIMTLTCMLCIVLHLQGHKWDFTLRSLEVGTTLLVTESCNCFGVDFDRLGLMTIFICDTALLTVAKNIKIQQKQ